MLSRLQVALFALLLVACGDRERSDSSGHESPDLPSRTAGPADKPARSASGNATEVPESAETPLASFPPEQQPAVLADRIYQVPDKDLDLVIEDIGTREDAALRQALLITVYEETTLRPAFTRLPLLVELARQPDLEPSLRNTIVAELGATLNAEHGTSWADWALAVDEHLAETEGLLRVE